MWKLAPRALDETRLYRKGLWDCCNLLAKLPGTEANRLQICFIFSFGLSSVFYNFRLKKNEFSRGFWSQVSTFLPYKYNGIPAVKRNPALV